MKLFSKVISILLNRPKLVLFIACVAVISAFFIVRSLKFQSSYLALLPENTPEVQALKKVKKVSGGTSELIIAISGPQKKRLAYARRLSEELKRSKLVQWAEVDTDLGFFKERALGLMPLDDLIRLRDSLKAEIAQKKEKANPLALDLEDEPKDVKAGQNLSEIKNELKTKIAALKKRRLTADGRYLLMSVIPNTSTSELGKSKRILAEIKMLAQRCKRVDEKDIGFRFSGAVVINQEQNRRMKEDLSYASMIALLLAIGIITLVSRRVSATLVVGLPLIIGVLFTLSFATIAIGHLNLVSGFMVAALVGLGVDFGIHLYLSFLDHMPQYDDAKEAMRFAISTTFRPSLTAATTTAAAFSALLIADFRGFSEYGLIAAVGVIITLLSTYLLLPPLALLIGSKFKDLGDEQTKRRIKRLRPLSRVLAWSMVVVGIVAVSMGSTGVENLRFYNHFKKLQGRSAEIQFNEYVSKNIGQSLSPALVMVKSIQDAKKVESTIKRHHSLFSSRIKKSASIASLLPSDLNARQSLAQDIRKDLETILYQADDWNKDLHMVQELYSMTTGLSWSEKDIPKNLKERLAGKEGKHYFVLLWPTHELLDDKRIADWAAGLNSLNALLKKEKIEAFILDENLIAAKVVELVKADGPVVLALAGFVVVFLLILDLRRLNDIVLVVTMIGLGFMGMLALMSALDISFNLFNVVVLPTVLGIGVDNAVHLIHRYRAKGKGSISYVIATAGRAALLSSLTTAIGFGVLIIAQHTGIALLGIVALVGISSCFIASTVFMPALLQILEGLKSAESKDNRVQTRASSCTTVNELSTSLTN